MMNSSLEDGEAIGGKWLSKAIETAQRKVEARNYDVRKQLVEYDDVMNDQRKVIYNQRDEIMDANTVDERDGGYAHRYRQCAGCRILPGRNLSRAMGHTGAERKNPRSARA